MKHFVIAILLGFTSLTMADGHSELGLNKRQPDATMNVTSVQLGQEMTTPVF